MDTIHEIDTLESFKNASEDILENLFTTKSTHQHGFEPHLIQAAKEDIKILLEDCDFDINKITEQLQGRDWTEDRVQCFVTLLEERKTELLHGALLTHTSQYGETVIDHDWKLKLVLGTSDLKTLQYPLLQLVLNTISSKGEEKKHLYDIRKDMLAKLIRILENAINED